MVLRSWNEGLRRNIAVDSESGLESLPSDALDGSWVAETLFPQAEMYSFTGLGGYNCGTFLVQQVFSHVKCMLNLPGTVREK